MGKKTVAAPQVQWLNLYRDGDYIAGGKGLRNGQASSPGFHEESLGEGWHGGYFEDPKVWRRVRDWINEDKRADT